MNPNLRYIGNEANFLKNIGFRIQFFRKKSGLSQEELAEKSGLSYSTISHIESSTPYPMSIDGGCFGLFFAVFRSTRRFQMAAFLHSLHRFQAA